MRENTCLFVLSDSYRIFLLGAVPPSFARALSTFLPLSRTLSAMQSNSNLKSERSNKSNYKVENQFQPSLAEPSYYKTDDEELNRFMANQQNMLQHRDVCLKFVGIEIIFLFMLLVVQAYVWQEHSTFDKWYYQILGIWVKISSFYLPSAS